MPALRSRVTINRGIIRDLNQDIESVDRKVQNASRKAYRAVFPRLERRLSKYAPQRPRGVKFKFSTAKSRRFWFAAIAGRIPGVVIPTRNGRYARTGTLGRRWLADFVVQDGRIDFTIANDYTSTWRGKTRSIAALVGGPLAERSRLRQVPGHAQTWGRGRYRRIVTSEQDNFRTALKQSLRGINFASGVRSRNQ